jgi:hypothetical protein
MKKSLWLLLVVAALIAVFAVAGCMQGTTPEEETTTPPPTTTPADTACPQVVSTTVSKLYSTDEGYKQFQIKITFDEEISPASCIYDPANWYIKIENSIPWVLDDDVDGVYNDAAGTYARKLDTAGKSGYKNAITIKSVSISTDKKSIIVKASVTDDWQALNDGDKDPFEGIICGLADIDRFLNSEDIAKTKDYAKNSSATYYADKISWQITGCAIADVPGNVCCTFSGNDCCDEPVCETCVEYCPLGEGTCI